MGIDFKISVIIPTYNCGKYIERSINSVLKQTYKPFEIVIVDDGSTDDTSEIVRSSGEHVTYYFKSNGGVSSARNEGIKLSRGDWIAFLDADDEWLDTHLENFIKVISHKPDLMWYGAPVRQINEVTGKILYDFKLRRRSSLINNMYFSDYLSALPPDGFFSTPTMVIHKSVFLKLGLFDTCKRNGEDISMWFKIGLHCPEIGYCGKIGATVFKREESVSHTKKWDPDQAIMRCIESEKYANNLGVEYAFRAEPRIIYWIKKLIKASITHNDLRTIRRIKERYYKRLPLDYQIILQVIVIWPSV